MALDIASAVYTLTLGIMNYIGEQEERTAISARIAAVVKQIGRIVQPLTKHNDLDPAVKECLEDLENLLTATLSHLEAWSNRRSKQLVVVVNPWQVTHQLREDREQLFQEFGLLVGAMNIAHWEGYRFVSPKPTLLAPVQSSPTTSSWSSRSRSRSISPLRASPTPLWASEANDFWERYFEIEVVESGEFCEAVSKYLHHKLDDTAYKRLLLRLDVHDTGFVLYSRFEEFVGHERIRDMIEMYSSDPPLPLLIWVDDNINGNSNKVRDVISCGVAVVQLPSTSHAKAWITAYYEFLKKYDNSGHIRFISDQNRTERNSDGVLMHNRNAGQDILQYIRDQGFKAPILIYTSRQSISLTKYVTQYEMAGSMTANYPVFLEYISALGNGKKDDFRWRRYNA